MKEVMIDGSRYETVRWGQPDSSRPTIVLLHGGLGSVSHWRGFAEALAQQSGFSVFAYSRLGHGNSAPPPSQLTHLFMHREAAETLPSILRTVGIERPILVGHSDGASIALLHASMYPKQQRAVVVIAPHVCVEAKATTRIEAMVSKWATSTLRQRLMGHHCSADDLFHSWSQVWLSAEFAQWDIREQLPAIQAPLLVLQGIEDEFATELQVSSITTRLPSTEVLWIPNCGHEPFRSSPEETLGAILHFLTSHANC